MSKGNKEQNSFFSNIYDDIYNLGDGYLSVLKKICKTVFHFFAVIFGFIFRSVRSLFLCAEKTMKKYFRIAAAEAKQFLSEVKRASPSIASSFKENPVKGIGRFFKYTSHAFAVHKRFNRAVVSTLIPLAALTVLLFLAGNLGGLTFALRVSVDGKNVGTVKSESIYKEAEKEAEKRFRLVDSDIAVLLPEYKITLTAMNSLDDKETVCNNIISAVSDKTLNACGIYINGDFVCAVESEDSFNRVKSRILTEYAAENGLTSDDCSVEFNDDITVLTGLYPYNDKIWSAYELYGYLNGNKVEGKEYTVSQDDTLETILEKNNITEAELKDLNAELDTSDIPQGSVLLIKKSERNFSIKTTVTYVKAEIIPYSTVSQYDNRLYVGNNMTIVSGSYGQDVVSYTDTYVDGRLVSSKNEIVRFNAKSPVNELIKIGTKGIPIDENSDTPVSPRLLRDQGGRFIWPAPDNCFWLSQGYNPNNSHYGIDICSSDSGSSRGRRIVSVADGIVVLATYHYSWGYYIRVDHGDGVVTGYAHALEGSFKVNVGDYVKAGQQLSSIGTTGNSTGYHLHFEVWLDGVRVNPLPYVYSSYTGVAVK